MRDFHLTVRGQKFYDFDVPRIAESLERIAKQLEANNKPPEEKKTLPPTYDEIFNYLEANRQIWHDKYLKQGAVPFGVAKTVMNTLVRLMVKLQKEF